MILILLFAFIAGVVTVLSPCILPLLPIILSSADGRGKQKPLGVVLGFVASFTFFTLFLSSIVRISGIPADALRSVSMVVLALFGVSLLIPWVQLQLEILFSRFANLVPTSQNRSGFIGGVIIGLSLGLLWTPCVGPILASVITLALAGEVTAQAFFITLAYAIGTALPMLGIMLAGSTALQRVPWLVRNTPKIQRGFGVLMILTAVAILFNLDRRFQTYILETFPNYGVGLTQFEDNQTVNQELEKIQRRDKQSSLLTDFRQLTAPMAPELIAGGQWFNSQPLQLSQLQGKVVLVDFWTYSCINCIRTLPYLRNWWSKYQDKGLVIIGVHSPEFEFEKSPANVQKAITDFEITYPVMQDNNFETWEAYSNRYWPAKYLIDKDGKIRYSHFGEGEYDETEGMIQTLLEENGVQVSELKISNQDYRIYSRTPELYLGHSRLQYLASPERIQTDKLSSYSLPSNLPANYFAFRGDWTVMPEYSAPLKGSQLHLNFESQEVFLVARSTKESGQFKVLVDGQTQNLGSDVKEGVVTVESDRLYHLIKLPQPGKHHLILEFLDDNVEIYAFTFG